MTVKRTKEHEEAVAAALLNAEIEAAKAAHVSSATSPAGDSVSYRTPEEVAQQIDAHNVASTSRTGGIGMKIRGVRMRRP